MQALLLATGESNKLPALAGSRPAPMLPIANRPLMAYAIELLVRQGIKRIVVSLYRSPGSIEAWFGSGARWGVELQYVLQREPWGTGGALKWAESCFDETFLVLPVDMLVDVQLAALLACHRQQKNVATFQFHKNVKTEAVHSGIALPGALQLPGAPTGVCLLEPSVMAHIPPRSSFDHLHDLIPALQSAGKRIGGLSSNGYYNALSSYQDYQDAQQHFLLSAFAEGRAQLNGTPPIRYPTLEGNHIAAGVWTGRNRLIHPHARIAPPVYIGANCRIGRDVELGPGTVIGDNVVIDEGATIRESTILENTYVGKFVNLERRIVDHTLIIDPLAGKTTRVVDAFLLAGVQQSGVTGALRRGADALIAFLLLLCLLPLLTLALPLRLMTGRAFIWVAREAGRDGRTIVRLPRLSTRRAGGAIPRLGRIVERLEWHRIPELWSVCRGDLALVGVMPLTPAQAKCLTEGWHQTRYHQPSGVTGLWYVRSVHNADLDEILVADAYYAATCSEIEKIRLLLRTPLAWWRRIRS